MLEYDSGRAAKEMRLGVDVPELGGVWRRDAGVDLERRARETNVPMFPKPPNGVRLPFKPPVSFSLPLLFPLARETSPVSDSDDCTGSTTIGVAGVVSAPKLDTDGLGLGLPMLPLPSTFRRFMTLFKGGLLGLVELVCTPFVNSLEMDAVAVLVPARGATTGVRGMNAGGLREIASFVVVLLALLRLSSSFETASLGGGCAGGGCSSSIRRRLAMVCLATKPSDDDEDTSSSVPSGGGVNSRTWCDGVRSVRVLLLERDDLEDEVPNDDWSADTERRFILGEWNEDGGCVDRERRAEGEVVTPAPVGGGGLEFLRLSEATPDRNEETKLDGADDVMFGTRLCLSIEIGAWGDGKGNVRVDDEAEALVLRLTALLLAARFASILYAGVDGSTSLAVSCGSNASGKVRDDEGMRLLVEDEAVEVEVPYTLLIVWKDG